MHSILKPLSFMILSIAIFGIVFGMPAAQSPPIREPVYCDAVLSNGAEYDVKEIAPHDLYGIFSSADDGGVTPESCEISNHHNSVKIEFKHFTPISEVLIFNYGNFNRIKSHITVLAIFGEKKWQCILKKKALEVHKNRNYSVFACEHGRMANAIQIASIARWNVVLTDDGALDTKHLPWLLIRKSAANEHDAENGQLDGSIKSVALEPGQCPPLDPYPGMPDNYKDHNLVLNGAINELLRKEPCNRESKFSGNTDGIYQCKHGTWEGSRPICKPIAPLTPPEVENCHWNAVGAHKLYVHRIVYNCSNGYTGEATYDVQSETWMGVPQRHRVLKTKLPPEVSHATWTYVRNDTRQEVVYTCDDGFYFTTTTTGIATYNIEKDDWTLVPECQRTLALFIRENWRTIAIIIAIAVLIAAIFCAVATIRRRMKWIEVPVPPAPLLGRNENVYDDGSYMEINDAILRSDLDVSYASRLTSLKEKQATVFRK